MLMWTFVKRGRLVNGEFWLENPLERRLENPLEFPLDYTVKKGPFYFCNFNTDSIGQKFHLKTLLTYTGMREFRLFRHISLENGTFERFFTAVF